jgi:hypothetical protein
MKENKLGTLLSSFKNEDWGAYHKFSKSKYSDDTDFQRVMTYIKKHKSRLDPKKMDAEGLRKKIRPTADPLVFANVISQLCKHIEAYFVWAEVMDDPMMEDTLLLQAFSKRGLTNQFHKQKKKAKINRGNQPLGLWNNYHEFMGEYLEYYKRMTISVSGSKVVLENCSNSFGKLSAAINGYLGVEMHNRKKVLAEIWESDYSAFSTHEENDFKGLNMLFDLYKRLKEKRDWGTFALLKKELINNSLSIDLKFTTITYLSGFLKWKNLNNDENASQELVNLYNFGLDHNILFPNKVIPLNTFATIIMIGATTNNHNWSEDFIDNYAHMVSDKNTEQIRSYGHAHLSYTKGNFNKTVEILRSKKFDDFIQELKAKWLLISSLYELNPNDFESFIYYTNSITSFIKRNKGKSSFEGDKAFLTSIDYLNRLIINGDLNKLETDIQNENKMVHKKWFLDKIKGLRGSTRSHI